MTLTGLGAAINADSLGLASSTTLSLEMVALNLLLAMGLSLILGWHFTRFGTTFSNRSRFARVLPPIALTTTLVISVVKASLALSLGLVGALSIVRFRTPVKEPEELAYLFLAIAIGLGMGADHRMVTSAAILLILAVLALRAFFRRESRYPNLYLNVELPQGAEREGTLQQVLAALTRHVPRVDMRRFDVQGGSLQATFYLECRDSERLTAIQEELRREFPDASLTFVEQTGIPGV